MDQIRKEKERTIPVLACAGWTLNCRDCEFKKCCKKYKHGKRCKKCPKSH